MNRRKLAVYLMAGAMLTSSMPVTAYAEPAAGTQEIESSSLVDDKTSATVPVQYTVGANFNVKLPSSITLSNTDGSWGYSGTVGVKGDIDSGKSVKVKPDSSITMYDVTNRPTDDVPANADDQAYSHKDAKDATVAQTKKQWSMTELSADTYSDTDLTLTAGAMQSGKWKGKLNVNISYGEYMVEPGIYDANGTLTTSWDELVSSGKITVADNVIQKCDTSVSGKLIVPEGITGIVSASSSSNEAFYNCTKLKEVVLPSTMTSIGNSAFYNCNRLTSITIPDSVTSIGNSTFSGCSGLHSITIPDSVTSIGNSAFYNCSSLTSITIPDSVTSIGNSAFYNCSSLTSITIPDGVTNIRKDVFFGCSSLTSITIPDSVTSIGNGAFSACYNLTSITIPDSVTSIGSNAFYGVTYIYYSGSATGSPWGAKYINPFIEGDYIYTDSSKTTLCKYCGEETSIIIPDSVTRIGDYAFQNCSNLTSVTIPDSVTIIGVSAFKNTGLTEVNLPSNLKEIESYAFQNTKLTSIRIPSGVNDIGTLSFAGIETDSEINVEYDGTAEQWNAITKNSNWNSRSFITTIHCTDGDITL